MKAKTKRQIISEISRVYDPLGFFLPITIKGRMLIQDLWKSKLKWDEEVGEKVYSEWNKICKSMNQIQRIKIQRFYNIFEKCELNIFADASSRAYGAVVHTQKVNIELKFSR